MAPSVWLDARPAWPTPAQARRAPEARGSSGSSGSSAPVSPDFFCYALRALRMRSAFTPQMMFWVAGQARPAGQGRWGGGKSNVQWLSPAKATPTSGQPGRQPAVGTGGTAGWEVKGLKFVAYAAFILTHQSDDRSCSRRFKYPGGKGVFFLRTPRGFAA